MPRGTAIKLILWCETDKDIWAMVDMFTLEGSSRKTFFKDMLLPSMMVVICETGVCHIFHFREMHR